MHKQKDWNRFLVLLFLLIGIVSNTYVLSQDSLSVQLIVVDSLQSGPDTLQLDVDDEIVEEIVLDTNSTVTIPLEAIEDTIVKELTQDELNDLAYEKKMIAIKNEIDLVYNKKVKGFINYFTVRNRNYLQIMERRKNLYFPLFEETLRKYKMPEEIKYLSIVESGLNPLAISRVGAAGLWQFMPATGREMGLMVNDFIDERLDPAKSTDAACRYLLRLYSIFDDWELALASYNCGPGVVRRAVRQSGRNNFWKIYDYLPSETRSYVPQFDAVIYVMNYMSEFDMAGDSIQFPIKTDTLLLRQLVNTHVLCEKLDICYEDFVLLNPAIRTNIIPEHLPYPIRLPREKKVEYLIRQDEIKECIKIHTTPIEVFTNDKRKSSSASVTYRQKIIHTVKSGEVLGKIAAKYGTTVSQIKAWNKLKSNTIRVGQKIIIYKVKYSNRQTRSNSRTTESAAIPKYYYVKPGDSLWTIAKRYEGLTIEKIKKLNNLKDNNIKVGQKLILS